MIHPVWKGGAARRAISYGLLLMCGGLLLAGACQPERTELAGDRSPVAPPAGLPKNLEAALIDTLFKYKHLREFQQRDDSSRYMLYGTETSLGKVGVIAFADSVLLLFQHVGNRFCLTNRIAFDNDISGIKETDLNGDGQDDFIVYGHPNMHGQAAPFVFLNDGKGRLRYNNTLGLRSLGLDYDPAKKLVRTEYVGGAYDMHSKKLYQWQGDSLRLVAGAELHLENPDTVVVRVYRVRNGKEYGVKTYREEIVYDTVLFKSNEF
jgi:hypothetical protein